MMSFENGVTFASKGSGSGAADGSTAPSHASHASQFFDSDAVSPA